MGDNKKFRMKCTLALLLLIILVSYRGAAEEGKAAASAEEAKPLQPGARAPKLTLKAVDGSAFDLDAALAEQPTVLVFYRGGW